MSTATRTMTEPQYAGTKNLEAMEEAVNYCRFLRNLVRSSSPNKRPLCVADFGAGIGTYSDCFALTEANVFCIEPDDAQRARLLANGFQVDDFSGAGRKYDYVYSLNVLEHIKDDVAALKALSDRLETGGRVLIYVPAFNVLWSKMDDLVGHQRRYTRTSLRRKLLAAGLVPVRIEYADSAGFLATLLFKVLPGSDGNINRSLLILFDRIAFPAGRILDRLGAKYIFGKNAFCIATKQ